MFRLIPCIFVSCCVVAHSAFLHTSDNPDIVADYDGNLPNRENHERLLRVMHPVINDDSVDFVENQRFLQEPRNETDTDFDINSLLASFVSERENSNATNTSTRSIEVNQLNGTSLNSTSVDTTSNDIRTEIVKAQTKVCKELKLGIHTKTINSIDLNYVYDVKMTASDSNAIDPYSIAMQVSQCLQKLLIFTHIQPYCDVLSKGSGDFRRSLFNSDDNDSNFAIFVRGVSFGASNEVLPSDNTPLQWKNIQGSCLRLESTNTLYLDDNLNSEIMMSLNETAFRESLLRLIATSFDNGKLLTCYKETKQFGLPEMTLLQFSQGDSDTVSLMGAAQSAPIEDNVSNAASDTQSSKKRTTTIVVILVLSVVINAMVALFIFTKKYGVPVNDTRSENASTISTSLRTGGSRAVLMFKSGFEKSKETAKTTSEFMVETYKLLKYRREVFANRRQGRVALEEDADRDHLKGTIVIKPNDTMESVCSGSFADEMGMEMMIQQMELESRSYLDMNKSLWFERDVFANTSFASMAFSSSAFSFMSSKKNSNDIKPANHEKESVSADPIKSTNPCISLPENQEQIKAMQEYQENVSTQHQDDDTKYFTEDEAIPYDEEKSLRSKESSESSVAGSEDSDNLSFLQVVLGDNGNSFNAIMMETTSDTSVADPSCVLNDTTLLNDTTRHSCDISTSSSTSTLSTMAKERLYLVADTVDL